MRMWNITAAFALAFVLGACGSTGSSSATSSSPRPSSTAKLAIVSPTNGEIVHGSTVQLKMSLSGAKIVPATTSHIVPNQGHIHVYLDGQVVSMTFGLTQTVQVTPGRHVITAEFVASDHQPFDPRVQTGVEFEVKP
jgi:hypothetical protein